MAALPSFSEPQSKPSALVFIQRCTFVAPLEAVIGPWSDCPHPTKVLFLGRRYPVMLQLGAGAAATGLRPETTRFFDRWNETRADPGGGRFLGSSRTAQADAVCRLSSHSLRSARRGPRERTSDNRRLPASRRASTRDEWGATLRISRRLWLPTASDNDYRPSG